MILKTRDAVLERVRAGLPFKDVIVLGAEINWRHWARHQPPEDDVPVGLA